MLIGNMMRIDDLIPKAKKEGKYLVCGDVFGGRGKSFKWNIENELWGDFSTGQSGRGVGSLLVARGEIPTSEIRPKGNRPIIADIDLFNPSDPLSGYKNKFRMCPIPGGKFINCWEYKNTNRLVEFYIARYDFIGHKEIIPYSNNGKEWIPGINKFGRTLYNAHLLNEFKNILIVEGEKCADVKVPGWLLITWQGGSNGWGRTDWSILADKNIILWPDADASGIKAMNMIKNIIDKRNTTKILNVDKWFIGEGYDIYDFINDGGNPLVAMES